MDILLPLFQLLYFVAHFLVSLALSVYDTFHVLHQLLLRFYSCLRSVGISSYRLQTDASMLKKVPEHLGIVIMGHNVNHVPNLMTVISWCVGYGVKYISLYDAHGILKQNKSSIVKSLENRSFGVDFDVITHGADHQLKESISVSNSQTRGANGTPRLVTVNLLSIEDGKGNLVAAARKSCSGKTDIDKSAVEECLVTCGQPDPEVVVIVGEPLTTLGFLPWQLRLTEFFDVPSLVRFEYNEFRTVMEKYSRCEQRCGK